MSRIVMKVLILLMVLITSCSSSPSDLTLNELSENIDSISNIAPKEIRLPEYLAVTINVRMKDYFTFIDSLANARLDSSTTFKEYILVNANPWIIDSLRSLDYYHQKAKGLFVYDQSKQIIFHKGDSLLIPDEIVTATILNSLYITQMDVNLPEYKLRIIQGRDTVFTCNIRIGQNKNMYLEFYQKEFDLRTPTGEGEIVEVRKNPKYFDLQTGEEYIETIRDDGRRTKMPIIPSLTPILNGKLSGTLIHATTNPKSLGKAYSHGCIGTSEPDIWSLYYYAPIGTKVKFRYDLNVKDELGNIKKLSDIYYRPDK